MPTYEYECDGCGISFERFQRISDDPIRTCPECGGSVRRLISAGGGLVFKGPGFYATDYGSSGSSASNRETDGSSAPGKESGSADGDKGKGAGSKEAAAGGHDDA
jgi:putative FmdB family regulatory protein